MADNQKFIVAELNGRLKTDYNLITFDALTAEALLQLLLDVLQSFGAAPKFSVRDADPADTNQLIVDALKKIQYRAAEPATFRRSLLQADRQTVYAILRFLFENVEKIANLIYLAQYLIPISMPPEAIASPEIAALWHDYGAVMNDFKETHKAHSEARQFSSKFRELRQDIDIIQLEKENVKKRLEVTQARLEKIPQHELFLETARTLRTERDRKKELDAQLDEQQQSAHREQAQQERLHKEVTAVRGALHETTPQQMLDTLAEEAQVIQFMCAQKLPHEIAAKQSECRLYEQVIAQPNIGARDDDYVAELQQQVDRAADEVRQIVEASAQQRGDGVHADNLVPFRVQAQTVQRNRELAAEQLDRSTKELRDVEQRLRDQQQRLDETVGGLILRGDELKQYVNMLRAKSSVYKQQRAEMAAVQAEVSDLQRTLDTLREQDPSLGINNAATAPADDEAAAVAAETTLEATPIPTSAMPAGAFELARLVDGLTRAVAAARERVAPISREMVTLRETVADLKESRDAAAQNYNGLKATFTAEAAVLQSNLTQLTADIARLESTWTALQEQHLRHAELWQRVSSSNGNDIVSGDDDNNVSAPGAELKQKQQQPQPRHGDLRDTITVQLREQEALAEQLNKAVQNSRSATGNARQQLAMWADLHALLDVKLACMRDAQTAGTGGTLLVQRGAETFTLQ